MATQHLSSVRHRLQALLVITCCVAAARSSALAADGPSSPGRASYRVSYSTGSNWKNTGSSTGIASRVVLTNQHVAPEVGGRVTLKNHVTGDSTKGTVVCVNRAYDMSLIFTDDEVDWVHVNTGGIDIEEEIHRVAYGGRGKLEQIACRFKHRKSTSLFDDRVRWTAVTEGSVGGDSGGGLFQGGQLVGVLHRTDGSQTLATETFYLSKMVEEFDEARGTRFG